MRMLPPILFCLAVLPAAVAANDQPSASLPDDTPISASAELYFQAEKILLSCARRYLKAFSSQEERRKWEKKMDGRIDTRIQDGDLGDRDAIFQRIALDWIASNESKVRNKDAEAIKIACFMFLRFIERRIHLPLLIRNRITLRDCDEIVREIDDLVAAKGE